jgi:hypothetical protein
MTRVTIFVLTFCVIAFGQSTPIRNDDLPPMPSGEVMLLGEPCADDASVIPPGYVMKFVRTGGYLGVCNAFWIYPDGRAINHLGKKAEIPPKIVEEWLGSIASMIPPRGALESESEPCSDCFEYHVHIYDENGSKTAKIFDPLPTESKDPALKGFLAMRDRLLHLRWK